MNQKVVCDCGHSARAHEWTGFGKPGCQYCECESTPESMEIHTLKAENKRLAGESEIQRGLFNAAMDRADKAEAENERLRNEVVRLVETFENVSSTLGPGRGYGSGAIETARKVLEVTK